MKISIRRAAAVCSVATIGLMGTAQHSFSQANANGSTAINPARDVGFDQKLGSQIPLNLEFNDEKGKTVRLSDYFGQKPVVMVLVWYKCPGICSVELEGMVKSFQDQKFDIGKDYNVLTLSINPKETPEIALAKKSEYTGIYGRGGAEEGWHFLTGDEPSIKALAASIGYRYVYDAKTDQYAHPAGILVLTPQGKVSRYLFGIEYPPKDLRFALIEASSGHIGTAVDKALLLLCYHYDPAIGRYSMSLTRLLQVAGVLTVLIIATFIGLMIRSEKRQTREMASREAEPEPASGS